MKLTEDEVAKLKDERRRGAYAQEVLDNLAFRDATQQLRDKYISAWMKAPLQDMEGQHYIRVLLAAHDSVISSITEIMRTGQMAELTLNTNPFRARSRKGQEDNDE